MGCIVGITRMENEKISGTVSWRIVDLMILPIKLILRTSQDLTLAGPPQGSLSEVHTWKRIPTQSWLAVGESNVLTEAS